MSEEKENGADVALKFAGQEVNLRNVKSLNTIATVATLVVCAVGFAVGYQMITAHAQDSRDNGKEFVQAIKEQTQAVKEQTAASREQTCILGFDQKDRPQQAQFCKSITR
jgi:hypothetical protein